MTEIVGAWYLRADKVTRARDAWEAQSVALAFHMAVVRRPRRVVLSVAHRVVICQLSCDALTIGL